MTIHMGLEKAGTSEWEKQERRRTENTVGILDSVEDTLRSMRNVLRGHNAKDSQKVKRYEALREMVVEDLTLIAKGWEAAHKKQK